MAGASGVIYGVRLLQILRQIDGQASVFSRPGGGAVRKPSAFLRVFGSRLGGSRLL